MTKPAGHVQNFSHRKDRDQHHRQLNTIEQVGQPEGHASLPGHGIDADHAQGQAQKQGNKTTDAGSSHHHSDRGKGHDGQGKVVCRCEDKGQLGNDRSGKGQRQGSDSAGNKRANRGRGQGRRAPSTACHLVAFQGRHHGTGFAGGVDQNGSGRASIHGAVKHPGEHDEGRDRADGDGDRQ